MERMGTRVAAFLCCLVLLAGVGAPGPARAATLAATADRTELAVGETLNLILSLTGGDSTRPPDVSALTKDFEILDRRRGSRTLTVDGKRVQVNEWVILLSPKRAGPLTIPALSVGGQTSQPVRVEVSAASAVDPNEDRPLFVQLDVRKTDAYVQGEIPVSLRIYDSVGIRSGALTRPEAEGASFVTKGEQQSYVRTIGRQRYRVYQQDYVMTPQRSGTIHIQPITLKATIPGTVNTSLDAEMARLLGRPVSPTPWLEAGREINLHSNPVNVEVNARPADATGWFLPAKAVTLTGAWSSPPGEAKVGDALTRTIRLSAVGATPNQLPSLAPLPVDGLRQYEEESRPESTLVQGEPAAELMQVVSVVPTRAGTFTLPAVEVDWWNTQANRQEKAVLPAETLTVAAGAAEPPPPVSQPVAIVTDTPEETPSAAPVARGVDFASDWILPVLAELERNARLLAAVGAGLVTLGLFFAVIGRHRRRRSKALRPRAEGRPRGPFSPLRAGGEAETAAALRALRQAGRRDDARAAQAAYLTFLRAAGAPRSPELEVAARDLGRHLHGSATGVWKGRGLVSAVKSEEKARRPQRRGRGARLAPLYPVEG